MTGSHTRAWACSRLTLKKASCSLRLVACSSSASSNACTPLLVVWTCPSAEGAEHTFVFHELGARHSTAVRHANRLPTAEKPNPSRPALCNHPEAVARAEVNCPSPLSRPRLYCTDARRQEAYRLRLKSRRTGPRGKRPKTQGAKKSQESPSINHGVDCVTKAAPKLFPVSVCECRYQATSWLGKTSSCDASQATSGAANGSNPSL